ncbi:hypothetical protein [Fulvivirga sedimenti]|uniref:Uncharacterized protein n=1 Tax=Fulvivirga sedimenti TaxID=2879465 RepID=A0A9X1HSF3_9BACT|nr:hypothetical protein [Fulvivirga sedimenti]MCA6074566.1 hypothetical protein [Fulvivirga sedimenti]MCA6075743.1 hypothetical protein [Fulvivirga sedimenti]MCA6076871.1 hypothetical protein [Fulvivirga sedimenti]
MKSILTGIFCLIVVMAYSSDKPMPLSEEVQSINALTFSPEGILFIGDSKSAKIFALATSQESTASFGEVNLSKIDISIAQVLGTSVDMITIQDMAVHPKSGVIYMAVHAKNNQPVLLTVDQSGAINPVDLSTVSYSQKSIANAVEEDSKDRRGRPLRHWAISDIHFSGDQLLVTGLSNQEFGSTFRSISYPFSDDQQDASLEIYHAAHGQYETHSPVKTFTTATLNNETYVIASYTCTPLVLFPLSDLKKGEHIKGRTVAELGAGNTPLDMVILEKDGREVLLMANSNRPVMKILLSDIVSYEGSLTEPVDIPAATAGVPYLNFPMTNVIQMDKWGDSGWIMLKRQSNGDLDLITGNDFWL